ncbi:hypothetical protein VFPFJ_02561 [Purpureocillium lilacinum]|uniref:Uncharacterized protein n=1 Tax=Purpureocillium lilacinum TaxID=33203 RepID=A0A179HVB7_PURLI|nr:hypothetical protein VFPFJ_02561 [Purpureocillium lilacinum]OAQ93399.1 hypothetical protein VFPFJ_02561 [Purpureocillium lilacinum]
MTIRCKRLCRCVRVTPWTTPQSPKQCRCDRPDHWPNPEPIKHTTPSSKDPCTESFLSGSTPQELVPWDPELELFQWNFAGKDPESDWPAWVEAQLTCAWMNEG